MTPSPLIIAGMFIVILILTIWIYMIERRLRRLLWGKNAQTLEDTILRAKDGVVALARAHEEITSQLNDLNRRTRRSIQGIETVRFNAFGDGGSKQSFAVSLLNEEGDGVVLSSLYARDRVSVFAKPIKQHRSEHELTEEEREAITRARR